MLAPPHNSDATILLQGCCRQLGLNPGSKATIEQTHQLGLQSGIDQ
jgi:hypothetical protein